ncbi:MAG: hypothetical protein MHM6MM_006705 [Cercozoa sp. M6MM]
MNFPEDLTLDTGSETVVDTVEPPVSPSVVTAPQLLRWLRNCLQFDGPAAPKSLSDLKTGFAYCQLLDMLLPKGAVPLHQVDAGARHEAEYMRNWRIVTDIMHEHRLPYNVHSNMKELMRGRLPQHFDLLKFLYAYYVDFCLNDASMRARIQLYQPSVRRSRCKNSTGKMWGRSDSLPPPRRRCTQPRLHKLSTHTPLNSKVPRASALSSLSRHLDDDTRSKSRTRTRSSTSHMRRRRYTLHHVEPDSHCNKELTALRQENMRLQQQLKATAPATTMPPDVTLVRDAAAARDLRAVLKQAASGEDALSPQELLRQVVMRLWRDVPSDKGQIRHKKRAEAKLRIAVVNHESDHKTRSH